MSKNIVSSGLITCVITGFLAGCGGSSTPQAANEPDPIQQEIEKTVRAKGQQEIPPGYMMNSGGEIVPVDAPSESDQ